MSHRLAFIDLGNGRAWCREITSSTCSVRLKQNSHATVQVKLKLTYSPTWAGRLICKGRRSKPWLPCGSCFEFIYRNQPQVFKIVVLDCFWIAYRAGSACLRRCRRLRRAAAVGICPKMQGVCEGLFRTEMEPKANNIFNVSLSI
jgi:hypothetical protein